MNRRQTLDAIRRHFEETSEGLPASTFLRDHPTLLATAFRGLYWEKWNEAQFGKLG